MSLDREGYDPTDEKHDEIVSKITRDRRDQEIRDLKSVLSTNAGRRFIWRQLSIAGLFQNPFTGNNTTFFNCGKQEIAQRLLADVMEAEPSAFSKMQVEEKERQDAEDQKFLKESKDVR